MRQRTLQYNTKVGKETKKRREAQLAEIEEIYERISNRLFLEINNRKRLIEIQEVTKGLFEESEKLFKKSPVETITNLMLDMVNEAIRDTKSLGPTDVQLKRITEFVPAGDNPEVRDVQLVLNQVLKGQERFDKDLDRQIEQLGRTYRESELIVDCLSQLLRYDTELEKNEAEYGSEFPYWFLQDGYFNFNRLDTVDLSELFKLPNA